MKRNSKEIREGRGRVNSPMLARFTEKEIARFACEDDSDTTELGEPRQMLSQAEFAKKYFLSIRTVQQWEQKQRSPSESARVLLYAIARDAKAIERALRG
ncbi:MAG: hypothetical protein PXZ07_03790 [Candidatus Eremiobacteraeota bacterium]|nr:hypothetical protein [Candidatus Eremiobacteraeota bacterium]